MFQSHRNIQLNKKSLQTVSPFHLILSHKKSPAFDLCLHCSLCHQHNQELDHVFFVVCLCLQCPKGKRKPQAPQPTKSIFFAVSHPQSLPFLHPLFHFLDNKSFQNMDKVKNYLLKTLMFAHMFRELVLWNILDSLFHYIHRGIKVFSDEKRS